MTAQLSDEIAFEHSLHAITASSGEGLFDPLAWGLHPVASGEACWRGHACTYALTPAGALQLERLRVTLDDGVAPPAVGGHAPEPGETCFGTQYTGLALPVEFSGGLLLGADSIDELFAHMGLHPAWKYRRVHELVLAKGQLVDARDLSQEMSAFRSRRTHAEVLATTTTDGELAEWIERTFARTYRF